MSSAGAYASYATPAKPGAASPRLSEHQQQPIKSTSKAHDDILQVRPKWQDVWAMVLYWIVLGLTGGLAFWFVPYAYAAITSAPPPSGDNPPASDIFSWPIVTTGLGTGIGMSVLAIMGFIALLYRHPRQMIKMAFVVSAGLNFGIAILAAVLGAAVFAIVGFISGLITLLMLYLWRKRIPFSAVLLQTVIDVLRDYPATFGLQAASFLCTFAYLMLFTFTAMGILQAQKQHVLSNEAAYALTIFNAFSLFWSSQVFGNVVHTTVAGLVATFYFLNSATHRVANPTARSFKRAMTYSFGSICFGSLIVALIQTLRYILKSSRTRNGLANAILDCLLSIIEQLADYFNYYAYIHVAIYGKSYIDAASDTIRLIKSSGIEAIINDSLVDTVISVSSFGIGILAACSTGLVLFIMDANVTANLVFSLAAFVIGLASSMIMMTTVSSAVSTTFVCLAEDPAALQRTKPELYNLIASTHHNIAL